MRLSMIVLPLHRPEPIISWWQNQTAVMVPQSLRRQSGRFTDQTAMNLCWWQRIRMEIIHSVLQLPMRRRRRDINCISLVWSFHWWQMEKKLCEWICWRYRKVIFISLVKEDSGDSNRRTFALNMRQQSSRYIVISLVTLRRGYFRRQLFWKAEKICPRMQSLQMIQS